MFFFFCIEMWFTFLNIYFYAVAWSIGEMKIQKRNPLLNNLIGTIIINCDIRTTIRIYILLHPGA